MASLFFDGDKKVIYEVPDLSSFTTDVNGYRIYVPDDIPSATLENVITTYDLWSRGVDFHNANKWIFLIFSLSGGSWRYTDPLLNEVYALIDIRLLNDWVLVPADYQHNWLIIGNLFPNAATGFDFDCSRLTAAGVSPRIQFADRGERSVVSGGTFTSGDRALLENIHGQAKRTLWIKPLVEVDGNGYQQTPYKLINSLIDDAEANGITTAYTLGDITLSKAMRNIVLEGIGLPTFNANGQNLKGMELRLLRLDGECDGANHFIARNCELSQGAGIFGYVDNCTLNGNIKLNGPSHLWHCGSNIEGAGYYSIDTNGFSLQTTKWNRSLGITNMVSGTHTIQMDGGQLHCDAGCTGGTIYLRGNYSKPPENLGTTLIIDQTEKAGLLGTESFP